MSNMGTEIEMAEAAGAPLLAVVPVSAGGSVPKPPGEALIEAVRFARCTLQMLPHGGPRKIGVLPVGDIGAARDIGVYLAHSYAEAGKSVACVVGDTDDLPAGQWMDRVKFVQSATEANREYVVFAGPGGDGVVVVGEESDLRGVRTAAERARSSGAHVLGEIVLRRSPSP